jgi:hypothetical protein
MQAPKPLKTYVLRFLLGVSNLFAMPISVLWVVGLDNKQVTNKKLGCEKYFYFRVT